MITPRHGAVADTVGEEALDDLTELPLDELVAPGNVALERAIRLARARRAGAGIVYAGFNNGDIRAIGAVDELDDDEDAP